MHPTPITRRARRVRPWIAIAAVAAVVGSGAQAAHAAGDTDPITPENGGVSVTDAAAVDNAFQISSTETQWYLVLMALEPVATADVQSKAKKAPGLGNKVTPSDPAVKQYADNLRQQQEEALADAGAGEPEQQYVYSFNGFAATLTPEEARELSQRDDVVSIRPDELVSVDTSSTPSYLGLDGDGALWDQLGGPEGSATDPGAGEDIVIGIIDSGIWADSASFAATDADGNSLYEGVPEGFTGSCVTGDEVGDDSWSDDLCNGKIIGAKYFNEAWGGNEGVMASNPWEFLSPRDYNGHGTHTASTAAGDYDVEVSGPAAVFGNISGIAPRARIAAYKGLWSTEDGLTANGYTADLLAAVDQAVADGVDVINYSVSGTSSDPLDPIEIAFLNAANAGVFVSASAGNSGPTPSTVAHPSPWITTVAAGTHDRALEGSVTLGDGQTFTGQSTAIEGTGPAEVIMGRDAVASGQSSAMAMRCYSAADNGGTPVLDPAKVEGKIVLCERGGDIARVNTSAAVAEAGGIGEILVNAFENTLNPDFHSVPTVHLSDADYPALQAYVQAGNATAEISAATVTHDADAPYIADFSSRGPLVAAGGDLLKPDLIAPGQDILAAVAPPGQMGLDFNLMSGTSMSAPHVAGLAALLQQRHPDWSPMAIKSALMTTGSDVKDGPNTDPTVIFGQGAGYVQPTTAVDPGLVYDSDVDDWLAFLCGETQGVNPEACADLKEQGHVFGAEGMNTPSIAIGMLDGSQTVTRTVTNVSDKKSTYTVSIEGLEGVTTTVEPQTLTLEPGQSADYSVTFEVSDAEQFTYLGGQLTWADETHSVRSPVVLRARQPGDESWSANWDGVSGTFGDSRDSGSAVFTSPDDSVVYMVGVAGPPSAGGLVTDLLTAAYDAETGDELWSVTWDGSEGSTDEPGGAWLSADGSTLFVSGTSGDDGFVQSIDTADGSINWTATHDGPGAGADTFKGLAVSPDESTLYVTGYSNMGDTQLDFVTASYDAATGQQNWVSYFDDEISGTDDARAIALSEDGKTIVVTGQSASNNGTFTDWGTVAYDAGTGQQLWNRYRNGSSGRTDIPDQITISGDLAIVAGAISNTDRQVDWAVVAYNINTGEEAWSAEHGGIGTDVPRGIVATDDGSTVIVTGNVDGSGMDWATIAYDIQTGEKKWEQTHNGSANALDIPWGITLNSDGSKVAVTGESTATETGDDYYTVVYDVATGDQVWAAAYDQLASPDGANGVAIDSQGRVFVTGTSAGFFDPMGTTGSNFDAVTLAYLDPIAAPADSPVTVEIGSKVAGGKVILTVSATNDTDGQATIELATDFGNKKLPNVKAGTTKTAVFQTKLAEVPAGAITVTVTDSEGVTTTQTVAYDAISAK